MKIYLNNKLLVCSSIGLAIASLSPLLPAQADTVQARCDVYPKADE
ncbi:hypothetical protein IQ264_20320 [Phormidium sp. LEGE 05292]|nr:hypothetical protein [Phormidium sp. LEGE 05292]MBE9227774.1 hypothetical protein [Phormidium sp. LEGE 05292]